MGSFICSICNKTHTTPYLKERCELLDVLSNRLAEIDNKIDDLLYERLDIRDALYKAQKGE